jgi:opacity protein-like surface antigen
MVKICIAVVAASFFSGTVFADTLDFDRATTFTLTSDGPVLHDTTTTPNSPPTTEDRITLSDTGKNGWYIAPNFAINMLSDFNNNRVAITYDDGYAFGISIGKEINPGFRLQLDVAQIENDLESLFINVVGGISVDVADAKITQTPVILNAIWEPRGHNRFSPFIGIGAGVIKGDYSVAQLPGTLSSTLDIDWAFAFQAKAGFKYELSHTSSLSVGYNFLHAHYSDDLDLNNNLVTIGLEFRF